MKQKLRLFTSLLLLAVASAAWGETATEEITLSGGQYVTDHIVWNGTSVTVQQLQGTSANAVNSSYIATPRVYKGHILSFEAKTGYAIKSITIAYETKYSGNSMTAGTTMDETGVTDNEAEVSRVWDTSTTGGTHVVSSVSADGLPAIYVQNVATTNVQLRPTAISVTYVTSGSTPATTYTVSFDAGDGTFVGNDDFPNASNSIEAGSYTLPSATPATGYTFDGWVATGSTEAVTGNYTVSGDVAFTAQYTQNSSGGPQTATLTSTNLELTGSAYLSGTKIINGITYSYTDLLPSQNRIQAKANTGTIKNTTPYPGDITSVVITHDGTARDATINGSADGVNWNQVATGSGSITADFSGKGYKYFQITRGANAAYWNKIEITYSETSLEQSDLTITNAATDLTFDLNNNTEAQVINYTTSSTGEVTISPAESDYFTISHDTENKKITVTPTAVTPGAQTVTIRQAADESYNAGAVTFTVTITDSTPFDGSMFIFNTDAGLTELGIDKPASGKGTDLDEEAGYTNGIVTMSITHGGTNTRVWNSNGNTDLRVYKDGGSLTFTVPAEYAITNVTFEGDDIHFDGLTGNVWTASGSAVNTVTFTNSATGSKISTIKVEYEENHDPIITASDVKIAYDATSGSISYTVENGVDGGTMAATTEADWLTMGDAGTTAVAFTATQNETALTRTAEVVLTYTYGTATTSKTITVTQTGNPNAKGAENNPYTVDEALEVISALADNGKTSEVYTTGTITRIQEVSVYDEATNQGYGNATYFISDGTNELEVFRGFYLDNTKFTAEDQIQLGDNVVVYGQLQKYVKGENVTPEITSGNYIVSLDRPEPITFDENAQNASDFAAVYNANVDGYKNVQMLREFGSYWNTLVVPFNLTRAQLEDAFGEGVQVAKYTGFDKPANIKFETVDGDVTRADLMIVKPAATVTNPIFKGVTLEEGKAYDYPSGWKNYSDTNFAINGRFAKQVLKDDDSGKVYFLNKQGLFTHPTSSGNVIRGFRWFIQLKTPDSSTGAKITLDVDGDVTSIDAIDNGQFATDAIYNLSGQRVNKAQKGIYIVNGKKVVVK